MQRWSPHPRESYAVDVDGTRAGLGLHPAFEDVGIWNLFWLSSPSIDQLITWDKEPDTVPVYVPSIAYAIGTGEQYLGGQLIKELTKQLTAAEFLRFVENSDYSKLIMSRMISPTEWFGIMNGKVDALHVIELEAIKLKNTRPRLKAVVLPFKRKAI